MTTTLFDKPEPTEAPMTATSIELVEHKATTPMDLLSVAVENNLDPDRLGKLMDLQERWEKNQAEKAFAEAMHACQQKMPKVVKNAVNKGTNTRYADLENVQSIARPIYSEFGFSLCFGEADCKLEKHKRTVCDVTHEKGHTRRYHIDLPVDGTGGGGNAIKGMNAVQGCISTTSYGQRRLTCMIFNIVIANEDDDGQMDTPITEEQLIILNEWLITAQADLPNFLSFMGVKSLVDIAAEDFDKALKALKNKHQRMQGR